jgi:D-amino-acid dehydrogenase
MSDVVVIGGGVVGVSAAYHLTRSGLNVTLVDRADEGQATAAGAGIISPATSVKPPAAYFPLAFKAVEYYPTLLAHLAEDGETETGYEVAGALFVATNDEEAERLPAVQRLVEERQLAGVSHIGMVSRVGAEGALDLFPALGHIEDAFHVAGAARVDGRLLRDALQRAAQKRGAAILHGDAMLARDGDGVQVTVDGRVLPAGAVVIAGGAWSHTLTDMLGVALPVYPQRGQILHLDVGEAETSHWPIVLGFHAHYILTFPRHRVVAGATREDDAGYDRRVTAGGVHEALGEALRVAPGLASATLREVRVGLRPASPDNLPILGAAPGLRDVYLATGHGASGLQLGPYSGALVADLIQGKSIPLALAPFAPERFHANTGWGVPHD